MICKSRIYINKFFLCYEWFSLNEKIKIETTGGAKITKNDQGCRMVNSDTVVSLLKNKISYKTSVDKRLNIYPILVGNVKQIILIEDYAKGIDSGNIEILLIGKGLNFEYISQLEEKIEKLIKRKVSFYLASKFLSERKHILLYEG